MLLVTAARTGACLHPPECQQESNVHEQDRPLGGRIRDVAGWPDAHPMPYHTTPPPHLLTARAESIPAYSALRMKQAKWEGPANLELSPGKQNLQSQYSTSHSEGMGKWLDCPIMCHDFSDPSVNSSLRAAARVLSQLLSLYPDSSDTSYTPVSQN